jgi:hypothetical protein
MIRSTCHAGDRRDVAEEIELQILIERCVDGVGRDRHQHGVAIRRGARGGFSAEIAAGARPIVDNELLAELLGQPLSSQARDDVRPAPRRKADDDLHGTRRVRLSPTKT